MEVARVTLSFLFNPIGLNKHLKYLPYFMVLILLSEFVLTKVIINKISYTEIDWIAYMQEVSGVMSGEYDYKHLRGDTGPLVYPAGFVYVYSLMYHFTEQGTNVLAAQFMFLWIYLYTLLVVLAIYRKTSSVAPVAMGLLTLSKRIHSIFVLRLFNDCVAMALVYTAILLFVHQRWRIGCVFFSLAVSVKMNILLFSPALLLLLIQSHSSIIGVIICLAICGSIQVILALPFLQHAPVSYLRGAFDLGRVFQFKWTVNWKFLPEDLFVSSHFAIMLLVLTLASWAYFFLVKSRGVKVSHDDGTTRKLSPDYIVYSLFVSNFVGVVFARTLHYQFYVWYFHQLPWLLWSTPLPLIVKFVVMVAVELAFNVYPASPHSSILLLGAHVVLFVGLVTSKVPSPVPDSKEYIQKTTKKTR